MPPKDTDRRANSVDKDLTAPQEAVSVGLHYVFATAYLQKKT